MPPTTSNIAASFRLHRPWSVMIAVNVALMAALVIYKYNTSHPIIQYSFLLADYHFGFMKRALLGSIIALFKDKTRLIEVFLLALTVWFLTIGLFVLLFKRTFGFSGDRLALFVFTFGSPFFFKNFFHTFGFLDIYGCLFAIIVLLIPVNRLFPLIVGLGSAALVLMHHLHFLLYVPAIAVIALVRFYCLRAFTPGDVFHGVIAAVPVCLAFGASVLFGTAPVPPEVLMDYFRSRATDPLEPYVNISVWYTSASEELAKTAAQFPRNAPRLPVYFALIALHWPLFRFMRRLYAAIPISGHRLLMLVGIVGITLGYVIIFVFVYDYGRWFASWMACMILMLFTLALLQPKGGALPAFTGTATQKSDVTLGWIVTAIPRVGLQIPF